jgi:apolipoprotein N-acyltransferase
MRLALLTVVAVAAVHAFTPAGGAADPVVQPSMVRVAAVQCSSDLGDVAANTAKLTALIREAAANGAKIVVLPEAAISGYLS